MYLSLYFLFYICTRKQAKDNGHENSRQTLHTS